jgi:hypothetical protein
MVGEAGQTEWRGDIMRYKGAHPDLKFAACSEAVFLTAWGELLDAFFDDDEAEAA